MNKLQQQIYEGIVLPALKDLMKPIEAHIVKIDGDNMRADVSYANMHGPGNKILKNIPIQVSSGFSTSGPFVGDRVIVDFPGGTIFNPVIVGIIDNDHDKLSRSQQQKHERKGAYVPDGMDARTGWEYTSNLF